MTRYRLYTWLILLAILAAIVWKLAENKRNMAEETRLAQVSRAFVPVEVVQPVFDTLATRLTADGIFLPSKEMWVISETQGRVLEVFKNKGEWLKEGEIIARVDDELLRTELDATMANLTKLRTDRDRLQRLVTGEAVPGSKIEEIELGIIAAEAKEKTLRKQISKTRITAPMSGTMGLRFIERGSVIGPGIQVAQMTNLKTLFLMAKVTEYDVLRIQKGQPVEVFPDVLTGKKIIGKVTNIGLRADNAFTYDVEITLDNPPGQPLRGGMHASAIFTFEQHRQGLTIPRRAMAGSAQDGRVFIVENDTIAKTKTFSPGLIYQDRVEVLDGLDTSDKVIVSGQLNLTDGSPVRIIQNINRN